MLLLAILSLWKPIYSQEYSVKIKSIGIEDGLTSRSINGFYQDKDGLIWMGSDFGLNRYDGNEVKTYTQENNQLVSNYVRWYAEDANDNLWLYGKDPNLGNRSALQVFDPLQGKAIALDKFFNGQLPFDATSVQGITSHLGSSDLWIVTDKGIFRYNPTQSDLPMLIIKVSLQMHDLEACERGLWLSEKGIIRLINPDGNELQNIQVDDHYEAYFYGLDPFDNVYYRQFLTNQKVNKVSVGVIYSTNRMFGSSQEAFWHKKRLIGLDPNQGHIWYDDEEKNTYIYDESLNEIHRFQRDEGFFSYPKPVFFDRLGNGWTNHNGRVNIIGLQRSKFTNYLTDIRTFGSNGYGTRGLFVDNDNNLYTNGLGRSYRINLNTGEREEFGPNSDFYVEGNWGDQISSKRLSLIEGSNGNLWYTDEGNRLTRLNPKTGEERNFTYSEDQHALNNQDPKKIGMLIHWSSYIDRNGRLWLGKDDGISYLEPSDSTMKLFRNYGPFQELRTAMVVGFHETNNAIWIASQTGLYKMDYQYNVIQRFHSQGEKGSYIPHNSIAHVHSIGDSILWLASKGGGLIRLNSVTGEYHQYTERDGLSDNTAYAIYEDDQGRFWVPSDKGIMQIDPSGFSVTTYLKGDGLYQEEFNTTSHYRAKNGRLFFGHLNGVTTFNPSDFVRPDDTNVQLIVTGFQTQSKKTGLYINGMTGFLDSDQIVLQPSQVGFNINYSLLNYLDSESNRYSYKIEGIDQEWNFIDQPFVRVNGLPYGKYNLQLRGQASQGLWSEVLSIPVFVLRPFYLKTWFIVSIILLALIIAYVVIKVRERTLLVRQEFLESEIDKRTLTIQEQAHELKELDELKSKFFANVSHELRTPLSLVVAPIRNLIKNSSIDEQGRKDLIRVKKNSEQIEKLVEEILDLTKLENKKITPHYKAIRPSQFFSRIHNNFESKAQTEDIRFVYTFKGEDSGFALDVDMTERILNNLLSNAFKFTPSGSSIEMTIEIDSMELIAKVEDQGIGISEKDLPHVFDRFFQTKDSQRAASGGTGIGLALSKELALAMDGDLTVASEQGTGSAFTLRLPNINASMLPKEATNGKSKTEKPKVSITAKKRNHVMVVEDHLDMRSFILENLQNQFHTIEAANGADALKVLHEVEHKPDIIISDMMMPEMDGMELLETIRNDENLTTIPVIMLTARTADKDKLEAFRLGADDYLVKPFSVEELKARIKNQLKVSEAKRVANLVSDVEYNHNNQLEEPAEEWLLKVKQLTQENVHKVDFNIASIAEKMGLSQRQFQRRLKSVTGYTPGVYLKEIRLQMARTYLEQKDYQQVQEVSMAVGFTSVNYFSRLYKNRFGKSPGEYFHQEA